MRQLLRAANLHDYQVQAKGQTARVYRAGVLVQDDELVDSRVSLYRPETKDGDPRMWFQGLSRLAGPGDVCAVFVVRGVIHLLNLSRSQIAHLAQGGVSSPAIQFLSKLAAGYQHWSRELLNQLREVARHGPLKAICQGDTAIGRTIEHALGIKPNSSKAPDFHGIEIKSGRSKVMSGRTRATLFACVPDWKFSSVKSSAELLAKFGRTIGTDSRLYCTVSTQRPNPQGLQLQLDDAIEWLREVSIRPSRQEVCVWEMKRLHDYLTTKHAETFWIGARSLYRNGTEHFELQSVTHTTNPSIPQFDRLLGDGGITLDHLIKRSSKKGVSEKGPLFRIQKPRLAELFLGQPRSYSLQ